MTEPDKYPITHYSGCGETALWIKAPLPGPNEKVHAAAFLRLDGSQPTDDRDGMFCGSCGAVVQPLDVGDSWRKAAGEQ